METIVLYVLIWSLVLVVLFWIMPTKKMKVVSKEVKSLLQVLPISEIIKSFKKGKNENAP